MAVTMRVVCVLFIIFVTAVTGDSGRGHPWVVELNQGNVRGYKEPDNNYYGFFGIPYATAPVGTNKYKAPLPPPKWSDTLEATNKNIICPQGQMMGPVAQDRSMMIFTENCLYANVLVPDTKETNLPVVVYVHGGAFQIGSGGLITHAPLVKTGKVIEVNFNYRLGAHGFLCLGTEDVPGNAGMKDMVAALRWVKNNIAKFRGNPNDVTIAGYSAGSAAVDLLMLSKSAQGLFNKVIPESGAAAGVWAIQTDPLENAKQFALKHNFTNVDDIVALERFYKTTSLDVLLADVFLDRKDSTFVFVPCVEKPTSGESFLEDSPFNILKKGDFNKAPILVGFAKDEGMFRLPLFSFWKDDINNHFENFLPADLKFKSNDEKVAVAKKVKKFYFKNKDITEETISEYVNYFTDVLFAYPILRSVRLYLEAGLDSVYLYEFSYFDESLPSMHNNYKGANHCAQSMTVGDASFLRFNETEDYTKLKKTMVDLWTSFITTGKPVPGKTSTFPSGWPAATLTTAPYMELNIMSELRHDLLKERIEFWNGIYDKYYRQPISPPSYDKPVKTEL